MSLSEDDVAKIAHLARLAMEPRETGSLGRELSSILDLVAQMDAVDTTGVSPMAHPLEMAQRLREDVVTEETGAICTRPAPRPSRTACLWCQRLSLIHI